MASSMLYFNCFVGFFFTKANSSLPCQRERERKKITYFSELCKLMFSLTEANSPVLVVVV
jgi:hypothetical protein